MSARVRAAFLFIGGSHQVFHSAPVAAELAKRGDIEVVCLIAEPAMRGLVERCAAAYAAPPLDIRDIAPPRWGRTLARLVRRESARKLPLLWSLRHELDGYDAIVTPELTSTIIRRFGVTRPLLIHLPHGAGDRAVAIEPRLARCDLVIVAGPKNAERMIAQGVLKRENAAVSGYIKLDLMPRLRSGQSKLFTNARPTVLYNPHFERSLSSLDAARDIVAQFAAQDRFNLIVAPHIRAFENANAAERSEWAALAVPDKIVIDLGSERSVDMTYALAGGIYLGDVSSQVYEFLAEPRPSVFVNAHGVAWQGDPSYLFWTLGEVAAPADVLSAVARAADRHPAFYDAQRAAVAAAFGSSIDGAAARAADVIAARLGLAIPAAAS